MHRNERDSVVIIRWDAARSVVCYGVRIGRKVGMVAWVGASGVEF